MANITSLKKRYLLMIGFLYLFSAGVLAQNAVTKTITTNDFRQEGRYLKINFTIIDSPAEYKFNIKKVAITDLSNQEIIPKSLRGDSLNIPVNRKNELVWDVIKDVDMLEGIKTITITLEYTYETTQLIEKEALQKIEDEKRQLNSVGWVGGVHRFNFGLCVGLGAALPSYNFDTTARIDNKPNAVVVFGGLSQRILFAKFIGFQFDFMLQYSANTSSTSNYIINSAIDFNVPITFNLYFLKVLEFKTGVIFNKMISRTEIYEEAYPSNVFYNYSQTSFKNDILFDVGLGLNIKKRVEWMVEYQRSIKNLANSASLPFTAKHNNNILFHFRFFLLR